MADAIQIGVLGEYDPKSPTLPSLEKSIQHATSELKIAANVTWLPTGGLLAANLDQKLKNFDGLWAAPGSPYNSFDVMLRGIEFARRRDWPFVGT
jgi:CTP synthase (UTP-ammonia lyase)